MTPNDREVLKQLPKAVLHEHLDGGLRVATILELADQVGYTALPSTDEDALRAWFFQGDSGSLESYLAAFEHTIGVMQTQDNISRVAFESVEDLANDGVVYAEIRFAPSLNTAGGLAVEGVIEAAHDGFARASREYPIVVGMIVTAMRNQPDSASIARTATRSRHLGVVGFDLAGPEVGFPVTLHVEACRIAREAGLGVSIHAGEADGPHSMWEAINVGGAHRIAHGVRVAEDTDFDGKQITALGSFASMVRDRQIPLEMAVSSNVHTGAFPDTAAHPIGALYRNGFNVSINTDNRLMSGVTLTDECALVSDTFGLLPDDLGRLTVRAIEAGFVDHPTRQELINDVVVPAYGLPANRDARPAV